MHVSMILWNEYFELECVEAVSENIQCIMNRYITVNE